MQILRLERDLLRRIWRAIIEFELLESGDRVIVGFSGGKDSGFLLAALAAAREKSPFPFELGAVHVDLGFDENADLTSLIAYCKTLGIELIVKHTQIGSLAVSNSKQSPCAQCAYFRRAVVNRVARQHGFNKVAYGHHFDDVVVTFLMSQLYSGKLAALPPKSYLERAELTVIRPLVYIREAEIERSVASIGFTPMTNPCPFDKTNQRKITQQLLAAIAETNPNVYHNLAAAMRDSHEIELWPKRLSKAQLRARHEKLMCRKPDH